MNENEEIRRSTSPGSFSARFHHVTGLIIFLPLSTPSKMIGMILQGIVSRRTNQEISLADWSLYGGAESFGSRPRRTVAIKPDVHVQAPGPPKEPSDFLWVMTEEPHRSRRMAILKAHPEVRHVLKSQDFT